MPRNRFSLLDLQTEVKFLRRRFVGSRVVNIYDITPTTYLLKISVPSRNGNLAEETNKATEPLNSNWEKTFVLIESGIRIHETRFYREKSNIPSGFSVKLRKHIRSRKIQQIRTIGADRAIEIVFGSRVVEGTLEKPCRLIVEFYSSGNIILTDEEYTILSALRSYKGPFGVTKETVHIFTRNRYPVHLLRWNISLSRNVVLALIKEASQAESVRNFLSAKLSCGPQVIEHALVASGFDLKAKIRDLFPNTETPEDGLSQKTLAFLQSIESFDPFLCGSDDTNDSVPLEQGYVFYKEDDISRRDDENVETLSTNFEKVIFEDFSPFLLSQLSSKRYIQFPTFNEAVDVYFSKLEKERAQIVASKQESVVSKKVESLRRDMERRVEELERAKEENFKIAEAIEMNADEVDKAIWVVRAMIANGVSWDELEKMLEEEKEKGNPVAETIHSLHLDRNEITLMLSCDSAVEEQEENMDQSLQPDSTDEGHDYTNETEEDFEKERMVAELNASKPVLLADIDLSLSAFANAARYFENKKRAHEKKEKTMEATKRALDVAGKKASKQVERSQQRSLKPAVAIREIRKPAWFEKFDWFISSENYLVIAGKDAQQNELVVKRYMRSYDIYVHADIHGASSVVVKNHFKDKPVPLQTIVEAGTFAVCHSAAWTSKVVTSAWWVHANQVSKTAPSGEYLTTGSFMIRGKKNYLPPSQLVMGYGIVFKLDPSCLRDHVTEGQGQASDTIDATEGRVETNEMLSSNEYRGENFEKFPESASTYNQELRWENNFQETDVAQLFDKYQESLSDKFRTVQLESENTLVERPGEVSEVRSEENSELITPSSMKKVRDNMKQARRGKPAQSKTCEENIAASVDSMEKVEINKLPRGKRSKMKRAKKKYAEQTMEERKLAMTLLGSSKSEKALLLTDEVNSRENVSNDLDNTRSSIGTESRTKQLPSSPSEGFKGDDEESNINEGITDETSLVNLFTGQPLESDIIEFAIPVCAPFLAISRYKYRVKLIPGSMKKGKAVKVVNTLLLKTAENNANLRDKDLMQAIPDQDSIQTMISNVKILAPGLQEVTSKKKRK